MVIQQVGVSISELYEGELVCPGCKSACTFEIRQSAPASCPVCDEVFGPRFTEAMQTFLRFVELARELDVGINCLVEVSGVNQEVGISEVAAASG